MKKILIMLLFIFIITPYSSNAFNNELKVENDLFELQKKLTNDINVKLDEKKINDFIDSIEKLVSSIINKDKISYDINSSTKINWTLVDWFFTLSNLSKYSFYIEEDTNIKFFIKNKDDLLLYTNIKSNLKFNDKIGNNSNHKLRSEYLITPTDMYLYINQLDFNINITKDLYSKYKVISEDEYLALEDTIKTYKKQIYTVVGKVLYKKMNHFNVNNTYLDNWYIKNIYTYYVNKIKENTKEVFLAKAEIVELLNSEKILKIYKQEGQNYYFIPNVEFLSKLNVINEKYLNEKFISESDINELNSTNLLLRKQLEVLWINKIIKKDDNYIYLFKENEFNDLFVIYLNFSKNNINNVWVANIEYLRNSKIKETWILFYGNNKIDFLYNKKWEINRNCDSQSISTRWYISLEDLRYNVKTNFPYNNICSTKDIVNMDINWTSYNKLNMKVNTKGEEIWKLDFALNENFDIKALLEFQYKNRGENIDIDTLIIKNDFYIKDFFTKSKNDFYINIESNKYWKLKLKNKYSSNLILDNSIEKLHNNFNKTINEMTLFDMYSIKPIDDNSTKEENNILENQDVDNIFNMDNY